MHWIRVCFVLSRFVVTRTFLFVLLAWIGYGPKLHAEDFYIQQNGNTSLIKNGDPSQYNPSYWKIILFRQGSSNNQWGCITGKSIESVQKQLKGAQNFETLYAKWSGVPAGELTYYNPSAPIAVMDSDSSGGSAQDGNVEKIGALWDKAGELIDAFKQAKDALPKDGKEENPFEGRGDAAKEYFDNLKDAIDSLNKLGTMLDNHLTGATNGINDELQRIGKELDDAGKALSSLLPNQAGSISDLNYDWYQNNPGLDANGADIAAKSKTHYVNSATLSGDILHIHASQSDSDTHDWDATRDWYTSLNNIDLNKTGSRDNGFFIVFKHAVNERTTDSDGTSEDSISGFQFLVFPDNDTEKRASATLKQLILSKSTTQQSTSRTNESGATASQSPMSEPTQSEGGQNSASSPAPQTPNNATTTTNDRPPQHVLVDSNGQQHPAVGYAWVNMDDHSQGVKWTPGAPDPNHPNIVAGEKENGWYAASGYTWANLNDSNDLSVRKIGGDSDGGGEQQHGNATIVGVSDNDTLNVRSGPGMDNDVAFTLSNGQAVQINGSSKYNGDTEWVPIAYGSQQGWVRNKYLRVTQTQTGNASNRNDLTSSKFGGNASNGNEATDADGTTHLYRPTNTNGWVPERGYRWVDPNNDKDLKVVKVDGNTATVFGVSDGDMLSFRSSPSADSDDNIVTVLRNGQMVEITNLDTYNSDSHWVPVSYGSQHGWVRKEYLRLGQTYKDILSLIKSMATSTDQ